MTTAENGSPRVRPVNAYYKDRAFYIITYALSGKMRQLAADPCTAFTACGIGVNCGHVLSPENEAIMTELRTVFAEWYGNGHVREEDPHTCILKIRLTSGVLFDHGTRYEFDWINEKEHKVLI